MAECDARAGMGERAGRWHAFRGLQRAIRRIGRVPRPAGTGQPEPGDTRQASPPRYTTSMNQISARLNGLVQSDIRRMSRECERVGGINLGQGICDLPTIPELVEGACDAISSSKATYSKFEGIDLLREQIARKIEHFNSFRVDPAKEIVATVGSTRGFATAMMPTLNAVDEVILFDPASRYPPTHPRLLPRATRSLPFPH